MSHHSPIFAGAAQILSESQAITLDAVDEDQAEEVEAFMSGLDLDENVARRPDYLRPAPDNAVDASEQQPVDLGQLSLNLKKASENIVVTNTLKEYARLWRAFGEFCARVGYIAEATEIDRLFPKIPADMPRWIAIWVMDKCDDTDILTGKPKAPSISRSTYATAQKMRAAISHKYGRDYELGGQQWVEDPLNPGTFKGNPSVSTIVSQYMISLRRRKVRAGEVVTSARAMTTSTMKLLFEFNISFGQRELARTSRNHLAQHPEDWCGHDIRMMLQLLYIVTMLCLLRFDEALRITWSDVFLEIMADGTPRVRLDLPFRKTHQNGGITPFYLYPNLEKPWMCPVTAWGIWWKICKQQKAQRWGFVFRKRIGKNRFSIDANDGMSADSFVECLRNNLLDVNVDPRPYGTHSFRRGGCQYLAMELRWPFRNICSWAGWAENFDSPGTLFKYLLSWNDAPLLDREDYFNPERAAADPCSACGRTCHCA